jgi:pyruvate/oxaloacetate carboxyltransferase
MERRNTNRWISEIKVAVINRDIEKLSKIGKEDIPKFDNLEDMREAQSLVNSAMKIFEEEQSKISKFLTEYKKLKNYNNKAMAQKSGWVG